MLRALPERGDLVGLRQQLVGSFTAHMSAVGMDHFEAAGMAVTWWEECVYELQTAVSRGYKAVIEAWLTTAIAGQDDKHAPDLHDQVALKLLAAPELAERAGLATAFAQLDAEIKSAEAVSDEDGDGDDEKLNSSEIKALKTKRTAANRKLKAVDNSLLATARKNLDDMNPDEAPAKAIGVLNDRLEALIADHYAVMERRALAWYDNLITKYGTTLPELEAERDESAGRLFKHLEALGYG